MSGDFLPELYIIETGWPFLFVSSDGDLSSEELKKVKFLHTVCKEILFRSIQFISAKSDINTYRAAALLISLALVSQTMAVSSPDAGCCMLLPRTYLAAANDNLSRANQL